MEDNVKAAMKRVVNTYGELVDLLMDNIVEVPDVNASLRSTLGDEKYQQIIASLQACGQADATAAAFIR